ncbi:MAG TPA: FtsW/RodA/SpoVE family cell cycle protein [Chitinophagaceae bacterium]
MRRNLERSFLLIITVVLSLLFYRLFSVLKKDFDEVHGRLAEGTMVNLNGDKRDERIRTLLEKGFYFEDKRDIAVASAAIAQGLNNSNVFIDNIGELNKRRFNVNTEDAYRTGGESYRKRVTLSRVLLGFAGADTNRFLQEKSSPPPLPATASIGLGKFAINGFIRDANKTAVPGVLVRLQMILPGDSIRASEGTGEISDSTATVIKRALIDSANNRKLQSLIAFTRTDASGKFSFTGLPDNNAFEVYPLQPGFQFGPSKGVTSLDENVTFNFTQAPHTIRVFSTRDFNNLKKEKALIVRMPENVVTWFWVIVGSFFIAFWLLHVLLTVRFPNADQLIVPVIMLLTGLSFLTLLSLQDPLRDRFLAKSMLGYFATGFAGIFILMLFDLRRFTTDSGLYRLFYFKDRQSAANGWPWAILAVVLLLLTIFFGTGPEGSGVKVNLFGFQPSEVVKFLIIIFLAGFFSVNEKFISEYTTWSKRWSFFSFALLAILASIGLFLVLGDLGPAMVVCFTFIVLFSFSRGDFAFASATALVFVLSVWLLKNVWLATGITTLLVILSTIVVQKKLSESSVMVLVVMAGFLLLDKIPFLHSLIPGPVQRLTDRKAIWENVWDNEVFGGDHIANSIWAMSSGGISGQGIGEGFAKTIPEAHTDMILPSLGEELGWAGILCIFILFLIYLHRSIVIGRQTGRPFLFYLCAGIGISTFVQFLLIAGGSTGALPLSGVSLPFLSYGGSSLIFNLLAAGFLLSSSIIYGSEVQRQFISRQQDKNLMPALVAACLGILLLGINVSRYVFNNSTWVVQPSLVADRSGARMYSYNPRIAILINRLEAGTIYDRKGKIMATSQPQLIRAQRDSLLKDGLERQELDALIRRRLDRYYPFNENTFFWTGDMNSGLFLGGTNGYFAEYAHEPELRGFSAPSLDFKTSSTRFREDRFLPRITKEMSVHKRDYKALAPLLLAGINSEEVEAFKKQNRDVQLTIDAGLQTSIQQSLKGIDSLQNSRISVVIMEDSTGDVLASAMFPLPSLEELEEINEGDLLPDKLSPWFTDKDIGFTHATQPGSTAKLATALAAFNKLGKSAAEKTIFVRQQDLIRIKSDEPDETGNISIERAIVRSNNPFFIRLANEEALEEQMGTIYLQTGMYLQGVGGYYFEGNTDNAVQQNRWREHWRNTAFRSRRYYDKNNIRATRGRGVSGMAWGQGELIASPAAMARLTCGIANNGKMRPNRFVLKLSDSVIQVNSPVQIARDSSYADFITSYMKQQSANKKTRLGIYVAGKTGTPERIVKNERINDGWYVFFAPKAKGEGHIVTCIRIENCKGSSVAVQLAGAQIIPALLEKGYIKSFETK